MLFRQSVREYDDVIGTSDPDLSDFRRAARCGTATYRGHGDPAVASSYRCTGRPHRYDGHFLIL
nr:hypothetical protein [Amycolatopsis orientalis]